MNKENKIINFKNEDSKKNISLELDKKMIFIYGKNGSGKTTFSRSNDLDKKYVFNEDFVYKNVYIIDAEGAKIDSGVKNNFSELLVGEDVVLLKEKQNKLEEIYKELNTKSNDNETFINSSLASNGIPNSYNFLKEKVDETFNYDETKTIEEQMEIYKSDLELEQTITNDKELEINVNQIKKHENIKLLIEKIKKIPLLEEFLFSEDYPILLKLNSDLDIINTNIQNIKSLEELGKKKRVEKNDFSIIRDCITLQEKVGTDICVLCGNTEIKAGIEEWKKIFQDKTVNLKTKVISELNDILKNCKTIIDDRKVYEPVAPGTINNIIIFIGIIENALKEMNLGNVLEIKYQEIVREKYTEDIIQKYKTIANYVLKKYKDKTIFLNSSLKSVGGKIKVIKENIEKILKLNADTHKESINSILKDLGLNKEITVGVDRLGGKIKYSLNVVNNNLSKLSDGQKHKLALAIFLNTIKNEDLKGKTVVFDDPVVALDELGYHFFKQYVIKNIMNNPNIEECPNLIILTHNFNYLYIQTSNIIISPNLQDNTKILKLNSDGFKELDFELFKLDDIALFKKCLDNIKYEDELIDLSSLYNKVFREFLDLKLRILGNPLNGNPAEEIKIIVSDEQTRKLLQEQSNKLSSYSKNKNITIEESKEGFCLLSDMLKTIGFDEYILPQNIDSIKNIVKREEIIYSDIFYIIHEISNILRNEDNKYKNYINYLNHPRISFTKNMMSTSMDA